MRIVLFLMIGLLVWGCDRERVYEKNYDFQERYWPVSDQPAFDFEVKDTVQTYNLYCNVRNAVEYPYSRIFVSYALQDSTNVLKKEMVSHFLFDEKTGKPLGDSGLGDIYDQQIPLLKNYSFKKAGTYKIQFAQFMRTDTLQGILAVGLRVEVAGKSVRK
jgi:gliding motility-associated lipoprotein GldH